MTHMLHSLRASLCVCIILGVSLMMTNAALAKPQVEVMPVEAVAKGQHGVGKTVVSGTQIEEFNVEILGIIRGQGPSGSLIFVRTSGDLINRTGGIAAGMSGSPVYVDGKLLGAVAYGFDMADHTLGLLTPAVDMVQVLNLATDTIRHSGNSSVPKQFLPQMVALSTGAEEAVRMRELLPANVAIAVPVATPLMVSGLGDRAKGLLGPALERWNVLSVPAGRLLGETTPPPLEPGSAFGVQLVRGDVELTALGTITYVDENGFVGFGHPFLNRGKVGYFVTGAYIHEVVRSIQAPFKVGAPLGAIGRLSQDRGSGVAGHIGGEPEYVNMQVAVNDRSVGRTKQFQAQVVYDESLTVPLVAITLLEAMDKALDRIGPGTATVKATIDGAGLPGPVTRDNIFFSSTDISATALSELIMAVQKLLGNDLALLQPHNISFTVDVEEERRTARIEKATVLTEQAAPGGVVDLEVVLRPFRDEPVKMSLRLPVPENAPEGEVIVSVRGGGYGVPRLLVSEVAAQLEEPVEEGDEENEFNIESDLERFIANLFDPDRNYELVAEYYPEPDVLKDDLALIDEKGSLAESVVKAPAGVKESKSVLKALLGSDVEPVKAKVATPYYIQGSINVSFQVVYPESNAQESENSNTSEG